MAQVVVTVNGRPYTMQCDDGEEEHLVELGQLLDNEVSGIKRAVGQVGDIRLLLMAGLVVADRLAESLKKIENLQSQVEQLRHSRSNAEVQGQNVEEKVSERLIAAAMRLEELAKERRGTG